MLTTPSTATRLMFSRNDIAIAALKPGIKADRLSEAEAALERSKALLDARHGPDHTDLDVVMIGLGNIDKARGEFARARDRYDRALALRLAFHGENHIYVVKVLVSIAELELARGDAEQAYRLYSRALAALDATGSRDQDHRERILAGQRLARLQYTSRR
jgi:tetratricopeptide (TPR) repeat protein